MKSFWILGQLLVAVCVLIPLQLSAQSTAPRALDGEYIALEKMANLTPEEAHTRWFHENTLIIKNGQVILDKDPVSFDQDGKHYSASDGGFYCYRGKLLNENGRYFMSLRLFQADYAILPEKPFKNIDVIPLKSTRDGINFNGVEYRRTRLKASKRKYLLGLLEHTPLEER